MRGSAATPCRAGSASERVTASGTSIAQRVELLGSEGLLLARNVLENTVEKSTVDGMTRAKPTYFFLGYMQDYPDAWAAFVDAVNSGANFPVTLGDGVTALALAEAATGAARSGRSEPVTADMRSVAGSRDRSRSE